jgi:hypothetical protein
MIAVDVMNTVTVDNPTFTPAEIRETIISTESNVDVYFSEAQVIREILVLPSPGIAAAPGCHLNVFLGDFRISHASWNGGEYGSFSLSLPAPIDVGTQTTFMVQLTALPSGTNGTCSAQVIALGTLMPAQ